MKTVPYLVLLLLLGSSFGIISQTSFLVPLSRDENTLDEIQVTITEVDKAQVIPIGDKVMLQPYYWLTPDNGLWWGMLEDYVPEFAEIGFDSMWLPPMSKTRGGDIGRGGYEPYDFYDLGEFDQEGAVATRFGTRNTLENLIQTANNYGIGVIADTVINHRQGGLPEFNPFTGTTTLTDFTQIASGKMKMNYTHFYPNEYAERDALQYGDFPDIAHKHPYVQDELIKWGFWLRDEIGFDGFRFDTANGIDAFMLKSWMQNITGVFGIAEYWMRHPDRNEISDYLDVANNRLVAFDFPLQVQIRDMANQDGGYDMRDLVDVGLSHLRTDSATVAVNHDNYRDGFNIETNRHMAYAFILTHPGYPSVFWMDFLNPDLHNHLKALVAVHNSFALGDLSVLHVDEDIYVGQRDGSSLSDTSGLLMAFNDNPTETKVVSVESKWRDVTLNELIGQASDVQVDAEGNIELEIPPMNFLVYGFGNPVANLSLVRYPSNHLVPDAIASAEIQIDGNFDEVWGEPIYRDSTGDGNLQPGDLGNLYVKSDQENLYVGFSYYRTHTGILDYPYQYGIALDTKDGGNNDVPTKNEIKFGGTKNVPDYLYFVSTELDGHKRSISTKSAYQWDTAWEKFDSDLEVVSGNMLGFIEMAIPLDEIDIEQTLGIKVFSTMDDSQYAIDSVPQDDTIERDDTSWLFIDHILDISVPDETTSTAPLSILVYFALIPLITRKKSKSQ